MINPYNDIIQYILQSDNVALIIVSGLLFFLGVPFINGLLSWILLNLNQRAALDAQRAEMEIKEREVELQHRLDLYDIKALDDRLNDDKKLLDGVNT